MSLNSPAIHSNKIKAGTCPHGMPLGSCPICNGISGGNSTSRRDHTAKPGEMSWNECAAIGAMLKAQKRARQSAKLAEQSRQFSLAQFQKNIASTHARLIEFSNIIKNSLPPNLSKPVNFLVTNIAGGVLKFMQVSVNYVSNIFQNTAQKYSEISDKLVAVFGEAKTALFDKVSRFIQSTKKKLKSIFFIFGVRETEDEEKKIEEAKRTFELKTFMQKIFKNLKKEKDKNKDAH